MFCSKCGASNDEDAKFCVSCGSALSSTTQSASCVQNPAVSSDGSYGVAAGGQTTINVQASMVPERNPMGTAGFVLALIGLFFSWIPIIGWIIWILGAILSIAGLFKNPKGLAIAGVVISFIGLIFLLLVIIGIGAGAGTLFLLGL